MNRTKKHNAMIRWFDGKAGEGIVRLDNGESVYIHFTAIEGITLNNLSWPTNADQERLSKIDGKKCIVEVIYDSHFTQVKKCKMIEGL